MIHDLKNVAIFHGTGGTPDSFWYPFIQAHLCNAGYRVWIPQLPDPNTPDIQVWLPFVLKSSEFNNETILIGHSAGCPLILSILENTKIPIKKAILVAGFSESLKGGNFPILQNQYNWEKIRSQCKQFIFINSDNDPWGCDDKEGRKMFDKLGGVQIILHGDGHMGSDSFNQPYKEFPLLLHLVKDF